VSHYPILSRENDEAITFSGRDFISGGIQHCPEPKRFEDPAYKNASLPAEQRVQDLLGRMTLQEKLPC